MTKYTATIRHHSISRAREITVDGTLAQAERAATREFGSEQADYNIVIAEINDGYAPMIVASRKVGESKWRRV